MATSTTSTTETFTGTTTPTTENTGGANSNPQTNQQNIIGSDIIQNTINKILNFFRANQSTDGFILDGGTSGWAAMSFAASNIYSDTVKIDSNDLASALKNYNFSDSADLNLCAAYPRQILALQALGDNRTTPSTTILIKKIKDLCFANGIYGQNGINDDVFGLIALISHGEPINSTLINNIITNIESDQTSEGAFTWAGYAGADITGAAINALIYARNHGAIINDGSITRAKNYLKSTQLTDGGWGWGESDVLTTAWVMMGINALDESQINWFKDTKNPWHVLTEKISGKDYYESAWAPGPDWFALKHAVPALAGKSWPITIPQRIFSENSTAQNTATGSFLEPSATSTTLMNTTTTSTPEINVINTTTPDIVTTTIFTASTTTEIFRTSTPGLIIPEVIPATIPRPKMIKNTEQKKVIAGNKISTSTYEIAPIVTTTMTVDPAPISNPSKNRLPGIILPSTGLILTLSTLAWRKRRGML